MSEITARIRSAGYWDVAIHPAVFNERRIPNVLDLYPIVQRSVVEVRGWDFPHLNRRADPVPHLDFIQAETEWEHHAERWRFYQSGQFMMLRAMAYDWRDRSGWWPADERWQRGAQLGIGDALFTLWEIFEFAARLSNSPAGDDRMRIHIEVGGLRARALVVDDPRRVGFSMEHRAEVDTFPIDRVLSRTELMAGADPLAIAAARELFARFGRDLSPDLLRDWLGKLLKS
jgi:hypothetical protein